jgi:preprotein translocase subunit SecY
MLLPSLITDGAIKPKLLKTFIYLSLYLVGLNVIIPFASLEMLTYLDYPDSSTIAERLGAMRAQSAFIHNISILALGVTPYYLASILSVLIIPIWFRNRAGNEKAILRLVQGITLIIAMLQAVLYSRTLSELFFNDQTTDFALPLTWLVLVAGAIICMWIADKISEQGLMDGRILLLSIELFIGLPSALLTELSNKLQSGQFLQLGIEASVWLLALAGVVALTQAIRYVPLKIEEEQNGEASKTEQPALRVHFNMVDEYPLGFVAHFNFLVLLPLINANPNSAFGQLLINFVDPVSLSGIAVTFCYTFLATYAFIAVMVNPRYYTELLDECNASIPGIARESLIPDFFRKLFYRLAFPLAVIMGLIGILPGLAMLIFDATPDFSAYFGGLSLFLIVSLMTDFFNKMEQTASGTSSMAGRSTTTDLDLAFEIEIEQN